MYSNSSHRIECMKTGESTGWGLRSPIRIKITIRIKIFYFAIGSFFQPSVASVKSLAVKHHSTTFFPAQ